VQLAGRIAIEVKRRLDTVKINVGTCALLSKRMVAEEALMVELVGQMLAKRPVT
jgi:hypothetical protein